jgi:hypothetical protein
MVTGWLCPFCGGTHMVSALLHGDIQSAWDFNAFALIVSGLIGVRTIGWLVEWLIQHKSESTRWIPYSISRFGVGLFIAICVGWVVFRNLV